MMLGDDLFFFLFLFRFLCYELFSFMKIGYVCVLFFSHFVFMFPSVADFNKRNGLTYYLIHLGPLCTGQICMFQQFP